MICKNCSMTMEKMDDAYWRCTNCKTSYLKYQGHGKCWNNWGEE